MEPYRLRRDTGARDTEGRDELEVPYRGAEVLQNPLYNRGSAFTHAERELLGLTGLLPPAVNTIEQQAVRMRESILRKEEPLEQYIGLAALQERNEVLFHRLLLDNIERFMPIVYTPTVGLACKRYSRIFRRARGLWITPGDAPRMRDVLRHAPHDGVRLIVVTDGERILGLGDQGAGGMGIPIGKLNLYTVAAGIHPSETLPVTLDVGTDNPELLADPLYLGWRHRRLRGREYDEVVEAFVEGVREVFPGALLQWEDFKQQNALRLLDRYRDRLPSFNDDIQGTAGIALAALISAARAAGTPLARSRVVIAGAGAAGIGIGRLLRAEFAAAGVAGEELVRAIGMLDSRGFLLAGRDDDDPFKREFAWPPALAADAGLPAGRPATLEETVAALRPTALIGTTGQAGQFTEAVVRTMAAHVERPAIFPFSNPTDLSEATPADLIAWTDGRALVATGSPFDPVEHRGRTYRPSQGNNVYVFPGVGLGVLVAGAARVSDELFSAAARAIAAMVTESDLAAGQLLPRLSELREVAAQVAMAVVREAGRQRLGSPVRDDEVESRVRARMWEPRYPAVRAVTRR